MTIGTSFSPALGNLRGASLPARTPEYSVAQSARSQSQLTVYTAEGDKVVISTAARELTATARAGSRIAALSSRERSVEISVDGDLNKRELNDIRRLARILVQAEREAGGGRTLEAVRTTARFAGLKSLARFEYTTQAEITREVEIRQPGAAQPAIGTAAPPSAAPILLTPVVEAA